MGGLNKRDREKGGGGGGGGEFQYVRGISKSLKGTNLTVVARRHPYKISTW